MYDVCLSLMILSHDGRAEVSRRLLLPFAPFPGLLIDFGDSGCAHVAEVEWSVAGGYFRGQCLAFDERDLAAEDQGGVGEWLDHYLDCGWRLALAPDTFRAAEASALRARRRGERGRCS
jgi:hypothetical protein